MTAQRLCLMVTSGVTATTFLGGYLRFLREQGWDVTLICNDGPGVAELSRVAGIAYEPLGMEREPAPWKDLRALFQAIRLLRRLRPDVLVYATPKASLIGSLAGWTTRIPRRVYELWGLRMETASGFGRHVFGALERLTMRLSTVVIANSRTLAARAVELRLNGLKEVAVIGEGSSHGVDTEYFSLGADMVELDPNLVASLVRSSTPVIGFIGRLHPDKGVDVLLDALRICADRGVDAQLLIVGADEGAGVDERIVGVQGSVAVHAPGHLVDVRAALRRMDVLVLPSRREGFPNVVLEAAAMGIPSIVSDATGCVDAVVDGETGLVVSVGDALGLANGIEALLADGELRRRLGANARRRAIADFSPREVWSRHSQRWTE